MAKKFVRKFNSKNPFSVVIVKSFLGNLADIYFRIEIGGKCFVVVSGIAVNDVQIVYFVEMVFGGVCCIDARYPGVKSATENGS